MSTPTLPKELESKMLIRFPDCDPFNHLNNSKYIDYIINAREDQLMKFYDFDVYKIAAEMGITWVVTQTQITYLSSAVLMETVTIQTRLLSCSEKNILLEAVMYNDEKTKIKAIMWTKFVHYNLVTKRSQEHSNTFLQFFKEVEFTLENNPSFDERVAHLLQINKLK